MLKQLAKGSAIVGASMLVAMFFEYVYLIFLAHHLDAGQFGILNISLSVLSILTTLLTYGVALSLAKFISEDTEAGRVKKHVYNTVAFVIVLSIMASALLMLLSRAMANDLSLPLTIVALVLPIYVLAILSNSIFQGLGRMTEFGITTIILAGTKLLFAVTLVYMAYGLLGALGSFLFASLAAILFIASRLKKYIVLSKPDFGLIRKIVDYSFKVSIIVIIFYIILKSDTILLKYLSIPNQLIGFYMGSALISRAVFYLSQAVAISLLPLLSSKKLKPHTLKKPALLLAVLMLAAIAFSTIFKEQIVSLLFPEAFASVSYMLPLMLMAMSTLGMSYIAVTIPIGMGRPDLGVRTSVLGLAVYLVSFFMLVPKHGIVGSAVSIFLGALAILVSTALLLRTTGPSAG